MDRKGIDTCRAALALLVAFLGIPVAIAAHGEEETLKKVQQAKYNYVTGNWDVRVKGEVRELVKSVKRHMPGLDYTLVEEDLKNSSEATLIFRGPGDQKVVVKFKEYATLTVFRIRIGLAGNQSKSVQLFTYLYRKM